MSKVLLKLVLTMLAIFHLTGAVACETKIIETSTRVGLVGCITKDSADALVEALRRDPRDIVIQSEGGDVAAAIKIAEEIQRHHLSILIRGYCHSSCSNYILPTALSVTVEVDSVVTYHGDARISLEIFTNRKHIDPMLLHILAGLSQAEESLEELSPNVSLIHTLQRIATTRTDREIEIILNGSLYQCKGMGLLPWSPSMALLIKLGIISRIVLLDKNILPEITFRTQDLTPVTVIDDKNPLDMCRKVVRR